MSKQPDSGTENLDRILKRVRALIDMAESEIAPGATDEERAATLREQQLAREKADALIFQYSIKQAMENSTRPAAERVKPMKIRVEVGRWDNDLLNYFTTLLGYTADHCQCMTRTRWSGDSWYADVYGFESDVRYMEYLYTILRAHMIGILAPRVNNQLSLDENCYRLHIAGYNWLEIAEMYGWGKYIYTGAETAGIKEPYKHWESGEIKPKTQVGSHFKRAYLRAAAKHGDQHVKIAAGGSHTYRKSAADGYTYRIGQRLRVLRQERATGSDIVLKDSKADVAAFFRQDNPELFEKPAEPAVAAKPGKKVRYRSMPAPKFDSRAYDVGRKFADTADLNTGVGGRAAREVK